jgi:hypothetical protein
VAFSLSGVSVAQGQTGLCHSVPGVSGLPAVRGRACALNGTVLALISANAVSAAFADLAAPPVRDKTSRAACRERRLPGWQRANFGTTCEVVPSADQGLSNAPYRPLRPVLRTSFASLAQMGRLPNPHTDGVWLSSSTIDLFPNRRHACIPTRQSRSRGYANTGPKPLKTIIKSRK